jgi:hypothetical protein
MENFTLEEATQLIGRTVILTKNLDAGHLQVWTDQSGTIVGVDGEFGPAGEPLICLVVQFWPTWKSALPGVLFIPKRMFQEYLSLTGGEE